MKHNKIHWINTRALTQTLFALSICYIFVAMFFTYNYEGTQQEIHANFYGAKIESDGKGAHTSARQPYTCVEKDVNLTYTYECNAFELIFSIANRLIIALIFTWIWFIFTPYKFLMTLCGILSIYGIFWFLEQKLLHKKEKV